MEAFNLILDRGLKLAAELLPTLTALFLVWVLWNSMQPKLDQIFIDFIVTLFGLWLSAISIHHLEQNTR